MSNKVSEYPNRSMPFRMCSALVAFFVFAAALAFWSARLAKAADTLYPTGLQLHLLAPTTIPSSPAAIYSADIYIVDIILVPQSTTSPTCTFVNGASTFTLYNAIPLTPNAKFNDHYITPLYMAGGLTWSCSDTTVKGQLVVSY
jgi:hypothetical protein